LTTKEPRFSQPWKNLQVRETVAGHDALDAITEGRLLVLFFLRRG